MNQMIRRKAAIFFLVTLLYWLFLFGGEKGGRGYQEKFQHVQPNKMPIMIVYCLETIIPTVPGQPRHL